MRRHLTGIIALVAFAVAAAEWWWHIVGLPGFDGASLRVGLLFTAVWLAYDQVQRLPAWTLVAFPIFLMLLVIRPRWALMALPLLLLLAVLTPRWSKPR